MNELPQPQVDFTFGWDAATVDAHAYAGYTYDYFYKRFSRTGLDNRNISMASLVHPVRREDLTTQPPSVVSLFYLNAFYAGDGIMVYGEGLPPGYVLAGTGQTVDYFSGALDIVGHELAHGVTDYTSDLIYRNESGALNEAFSDIIGASVEFFFQQAGSGYLRTLVFWTFVYVAASASWNILGGFAGQTSFGHSAFFGLGAYVTASPCGSTRSTPIQASSAAAGATAKAGVICAAMQPADSRSRRGESSARRRWRSPLARR